MSSWPLISDFARMLQNPQMGFRAPELKTCKVEMNHLGQPKARSGNFATVYRGYRPDASEFAIRIFNRRQDERLEHYRTISSYLENRAISSIVSFEYDEKGIRSAGDGKFYPLLTMEWVPGITLFEWTRDRCREGYAEALRIAGEVWLHLVRELAEHQVVHGDLQHGNVMVSPEGHFKLVDYDCMCVPALIGKRNLETGMTPYQHPGRNADTILFPGLDNFSALLIYVALRALAANPFLWITYVDQPEYDRLLFRPKDFENPAASPLYADLMHSPDDKVRDLTHYLFELSRYDLHDVPPIDEVLLWCESIESLISAAQWERVVKLVERMGPGDQIAPQYQPYIFEARQRVNCRREMEAALAKGDEARVAQLYATGLLNNYPDAAHLLEPASRAAAVPPVLQVLESALKLQAWDKLKATWLAHRELLTDRASTKAIQTEVEKLLAVDRLRELLAATPVDTTAVHETWNFLELHGGHATAEPIRADVQARLARQECLARLQELLRDAPKPPTLAYDKKISAACPPEHLAGMDPKSPLVSQYAAASQRLKLVRRIHEVEKAGTVESETFIAGVMKKLPNSYHEGLARRSQQARKRIFAYRELTAALQEPCRELAIIKAWRKLMEVNGRVLVTGPALERVHLAEARGPLIKLLRAIPESDSETERERKVAAIWEETLLHDCPDAQPWAELHQRAIAAGQAIEQLRVALEADDLAAVERLLALPCMERRELPADLADRVQQARAALQQARAAKRQAMVNALRDNNRVAFAELFDAALLADICRQFKHHQPVVGQWVEAEIVPLKFLGMTADPATALRREEDGTLRITWTWPPPHISTTCQLRICAKRPTGHVSPDDVESLHQATLQREQWNEATGYSIPFDPQFHDAFVVIWAVIDLGYQTFFSEPLILGPLEPAPKQRRWGLFSRRSGKPDAAAESTPGPAAESAFAAAPIAKSEEAP